MKVLVLGASGMIGSTMLRILAENAKWEVFGTIRSESKLRLISTALASRVIAGYDLGDNDAVRCLFNKYRPDVVVNCVGLTKHLPIGNEPIPAIKMNALLPHRLAEHCSISGARLIHISTDCVFSGRDGNYRESDTPDADDLYGKTKAMGEVSGSNILTLRTSTIGHEIGTRFGLLEWFLAQTQCIGFRKAIFSGLPTIEFAKVVREVVIPSPSLAGLYHVGGMAIDKFTLLHLIAKVYRKNTNIITDDSFHIDRSLNSDKFVSATCYRAPDWSDLIEAMYQDYLSEK